MCTSGFGTAGSIRAIVRSRITSGRIVVAPAAKTGAAPRRARAEGVFALERVRPVPAPAGRMREADATDRPLLIDWFTAFAEEALGEDATVEDPARFIDHRLTAADAGAVLWEDEGIVSLAAFGNPTPNGI